MNRVLVTQRIDPAGVAALEDAGLVVDMVDYDGPIPRAVLLERVAPCAGLMSMLTDRVDDAVLASARGLRVVANHAVGYDNVDTAAAMRRGVAVTNTPGVLTEATADLTMALLLCVARHVATGDRAVRAGRFRGWQPQAYLGMSMGGSVLGVIGAGRIGRAVARRAEAFGMRVILHDLDTGTTLEDVLASSDIVTLHCPLGPGTRHLLDAAALARMKQGAILINTSRGPVVDERALVEALRSGRLGGAGLDVYEDEPELAPGLADLENAVILPHIGSATTAVRRAMAVTAAEGIADVLGGREPRHRVA